jgi:hypothetical protein
VNLKCDPGLALELRAEHSAGYLEHGDTISEGIVLRALRENVRTVRGPALASCPRVLFVSLAAGPATSAARKRYPSCLVDTLPVSSMRMTSRFPHHAESIYLMHRRPRYLRHLSRRKVLGQWILRLYR